LVLKPVHLIPVDAGHKPAARFCLEWSLPNNTCMYMEKY
jgi:hypothetical protein